MFQWAKQAFIGTNFQYFNQFSLFLPTDDDDSGESKSHRSRLDPDAWTDDDHDDDDDDDDELMTGVNGIDFLDAS